MKSVKTNSIVFDGHLTPESKIKVSIELELPLQKQHERMQTYCTSEVIELLREKHKFSVANVVQMASISNVSEGTRKGSWVFLGEFFGDIPKDEEWVYKNPEVLNAIKEGLRQAEAGEFYTMDEVFAEVEEKISKKESKSIQRRKKLQKKEE